MFVSMLGDATKTLLHIALAPVRIPLALFYIPRFDNMQRRYFLSLNLLACVKTICKVSRIIFIAVCCFLLIKIKTTLLAIFLEIIVNL